MDRGYGSEGRGIGKYGRITVVCDAKFKIPRFFSADFGWILGTFLMQAAIFAIYILVTHLCFKKNLFAFQKIAYLRTLGELLQ